MRKKTIKEFIEKANFVHGDKYDYSKTEYINDSTRVCIICPKHGEFWKTPSNHLHKTKPQGCPFCTREMLSFKFKKSNDEFIKEAIAKHGNKYNYSKVEYINGDTDVCIICPEHGEFWQGAYLHLSGCGCSKCSKNYQKTTDEWISEAVKMHGNKYDYSKSVYTKSSNDICIVCPEHGVFWQNAKHHICGGGCSKCKSSHMENQIRSLLKENNIVFEEQKRFKWLGLQSLDFYLPDQNIAIECQGIQHFKPIEFFGGSNSLEKTIKRDKRKLDLCNINGVKLIYYSNLKQDFDNIITDKNKLLNIIKK